MMDGTQHIWRAAGCGYAHEGIFRLRAECQHILPPLLRIVFRPLHCPADGPVSPGNYADESPVQAVCRQDFGSVGDAQTAAGAGAGVEHPAAPLHPLHYSIYQAGNLRDAAGHCHRNLAVFGIDAPQQLLGGHRIQPGVQG